MRAVVRSLILSLSLLLVFLALALGAQTWLDRQTVRLRTEATVAAASRFDAALAAIGPVQAPVNEPTLRQLGQLLGGKVAEEAAAVSLAQPAGPARLVVDRPLTGTPDRVLRLTIQSVGLEQIQLFHQRGVIVIGVLAAVLVLIPVLVSLLAFPREKMAAGSRAPWANVTQLARLSAEQAAALAEARSERSRIAEDLATSRTLLDRSAEQRLRLGRELHDNICQTLYAVSLSLESVRKKMSAPPEIVARLDQAMIELKRLNGETRAFLHEIDSPALAREPFEVAVATLIRNFPTAEQVRIESRLDTDALALLPAQHTLEIVALLREAISNSQRHGEARKIVVRAERGETSVALGVVDDGRGFDPAAALSSPGHGLANMAARAAAIGGQLRVVSKPGEGTRVLLTIPLAAPAFP